MSKSDDRDEALRKTASETVESFLAHESMNETARYLARGRRYEAWTNADVQDRWVMAFKTWFADTSGSSDEVDDLAAELRLRGEEPPVDRISEETEIMRQQFLAIEKPDTSSMRERLAAYLKERDEPSA